ncbi:MAG: hypothetical protein OXI73_01650 [Rhodospirillales bacterium]|nr:hypothetical protein [Rhodospirillales bacterium]
MRAFPLVALGLLVVGCGGDLALVPHSVTLVEQTETVPEDELLDVGVVVFDPGIPDGEVEKEVLEALIEEGTFVHVRRTEARYLAVHLRNTLQKSGHWGTVWTMPGESSSADINITAAILYSDGERFRLRVHAADAIGNTWIDDEYEVKTAPGSFNRQQYPGLDPYQDVFNRIANDLAARKDALSAEHKRHIRTVAQLRFAADLSPEAFGDHVVQEQSGQYALSRLPADDDPQFQRTLQVRQREHLFVETLNEHYVDFYENSKDAYHAWRETAREEAVAIRKLEGSSRWNTVLGILAIVGSVAYELASDGDLMDDVISDTLMYSGASLLNSAELHRQEKQIHVSALEELSQSFDEEIKPIVVEIEGVQHRFTGTVEAQYEDWRELLRQIYLQETGFDSVQMYTDVLRDH